MRILMVLDANDKRGMFRHGFFLAKAMARGGHKVTIVYIDNEESIAEEDGVTIYRIAGFIQKLWFIYSQSNIRHHGPIPDWLIVKKLRAIIRNELPEVIHVHGWVLYSVARLKREINTPVITTLHDYGFICPTKTLLNNDQVICRDTPSLVNCLRCACTYYGLIKGVLTLYGIKKHMKLLRTSIDYYVAVSKFVKERYDCQLRVHKKSSVLPNFLSDHSRCDEMDPQRIILPGDFILFVGSSSSAKGVNILIDAYQKINTDVKLVLIGVNNYDFSVLHNKQIIAIEGQPHYVVMDAWRRCRFGVVPSVWPEPCPTVALEAMSCGKALIASEVGGLRDIMVQGETGILVPPGDSETLGLAIRTLLDHPCMAEEMGVRGRLRVRQFYDMANIIRRLEKIYCGVANEL